MAYLDQTKLAIEQIFNGLKIPWPGDNASVQDLVKSYQRAKSVSGGKKWVCQNLGGINEDQLQRLENCLKDVTRLDKDAGSRDTAIACLRLYNWFDCVGKRAMRIEFEPMLPQNQSEAVGLRQVRAVEMVIRALINEKYESQEGLEKRLRDLFKPEIVDGWKQHCDHGDILSGTMFSELATLFSGQEEYPNYDPLYQKSDALGVDVYSRRKTLHMFLEDIRIIRNSFAHNKKIGCVQLALLTAYYDALISPVEMAHGDGKTSVKPSAYLDISREELSGYFDKLVEDVKAVQESVKDIQHKLAEGFRNVEAGQARITSEVSRLRRSAPVIAVGVAVLILLGVGSVVMLKRLNRETKDTTKAVAATKQAVERQEEAVLQVAATGDQTLSQVNEQTQLLTNLSGRVDESVAEMSSATRGLAELAKQVRQSIGENKLGPEYDNTRDHVVYQNNYLKEGGTAEHLVLEYMGKAKIAPTNVMFKYLLARSYMLCGDDAAATSVAREGKRLDPVYTWNARFLLYETVALPERPQELLDLEREYYGISAAISTGLLSGDPARMKSALDELIQKYGHDPLRKADLSQYLCWHLNLGVSKAIFGDGKQFSEFTNRAAVSEGSVLSVSVRNCVTGYGAQRILGTLWRMTQDPNRAVHLVQVFPVAMQLQSKVLFRSALSDVTVQLLAVPDGNMELIDQLVIGEARGGLDGATHRSVGGFSYSREGGKTVVDNRNPGTAEKYDLTSPQPFWVAFYARPLTWKAAATNALQLKYSVVLDGDAHYSDIVQIVNGPFNELTGETDLSAVIREMSRLDGIPVAQLPGTRIVTPIEGFVSFTSQGRVDVSVLAQDQQGKEVRLIYAPFYPFALDGDDHIRMLNSVSGKWPLPYFSSLLKSLGDGTRIWFTGTVMAKEQGDLYVLPDMVTTWGQKTCFPIECPAQTRTVLLKQGVFLQGCKVIQARFPDDPVLDMDAPENEKVVFASVDDESVRVALHERGGKVVTYLIKGGQILKDSRQVSSD